MTSRPTNIQQHHHHQVAEPIRTQEEERQGHNVPNGDANEAQQQQPPQDNNVKSVAAEDAEDLKEARFCGDENVDPLAKLQPGEFARRLQTDLFMHPKRLQPIHSLGVRSTCSVCTAQAFQSRVGCMV